MKFQFLNFNLQQNHVSKQIYKDKHSKQASTSQVQAKAAENCGFYYLWAVNAAGRGRPHHILIPAILPRLSRSK